MNDSMSSMAECLVRWGATILVAVALIVRCKIYLKRTDSSQRHVIVDIGTCKKIFDCKKYLDDILTNQLTPSASRAIPNQRLVKAFNIYNGFTSQDPALGKRFKADASEKINISDDAWSKIAHISQTLVHQQISGADTHGDAIFLNRLAQSITLKISLSVLYGLEPSTLNSTAIAHIAEGIDARWRASKIPGSHCPISLVSLNQSLQTIFPALEIKEGRENPLNFILPAYETMWRAVLLGTISIAFPDERMSHPSNYSTVLVQYLQSPNKHTFEQIHPSEGGISVAHIAQEILRLFPPTKRVYRRYHFPNEEPQLLAADIEACHHDKTIWGDDAQTFKPERWRSIDEKTKESYMPFGAGKYACPARVEFAPMMVGLLVAAFVGQLTEAQREISKECTENRGRGKTEEDKGVKLVNRRGMANFIVRRKQ
ncbi:uncharacterized protein KY384_008989 [Bacidia gigantensis]|uniref:uncharacterized protein n=1 Tax=Bacidia gigantensis TaxID=2732470 RepID=UPI001D0436D9|nr:uncharacterized protein KY384_008989 [Bacidia gigantensis]KAG8525345.1 hypothetical protein KY384_008989 [Bacidia gigantensis]